MIALLGSEARKLATTRAVWVLALLAALGTWPMAWSNGASAAGLPVDSELLFSAVPIPVDYAGFEMAGFGHVLVIALAALWAGSEYGAGGQIRTTLLATPRRTRVFMTKAALLAALVAAVGLVAMVGTLVITHAVGDTGIDPWRLTPAIWARIAGVALAWTLIALVTFAIGVLARSAIAPLILVVPLAIGLGDFLAGLWEGARFLPTTAGAALYSDPETGPFLGALEGGLVLGGWAAALLLLAGVVFARRDL